MSVLDQFRTAEEQVAKRLRELKPLVAEYHELEHVAQRLGLSVSDDEPAAGHAAARVDQAGSPSPARRENHGAVSRIQARRKRRWWHRQGVGRSDAGATGALAADSAGNGGPARAARRADSKTSCVWSSSVPASP